MFGSIGYGFRGRRIEWRYLRFDKIQGGNWRPSWNDGAVARNPCVSWVMTETDEEGRNIGVEFISCDMSAGLSCICLVNTLK